MYTYEMLFAQYDITYHIKSDVCPGKVREWVDWAISELYLKLFSLNHSLDDSAKDQGGGGGGRGGLGGCNQTH